MKLKLFSILTIASLTASVLMVGFFFGADTAWATCPDGQVSSPPGTPIITAPSGTYNDPSTIPIVISVEHGFSCDENNEMYGAMATYTIRNSANAVVHQDSAGSISSCTKQLCPAGDLNINRSVNASSWLAGNYSMTVVATGPGESGPVSESSTFTITRPTSPPENPTFTLSCTPPTQTISPGGTTSFSLATTPSGGFNSAVNFTPSISPSSGTPPTVTFSNNGATPPATTTAVVTTTGSTTAGTYTITFTGTGGGSTEDCQTQLVVSSTPTSPGFSFNVTPNPKQISKGTDAVFTVTPVCTGGFNQAIGRLQASSEFTGVAYSFSAPSVACNSSVTLTVSNTAVVPQNQLSTVGNVLYKMITVTGQAETSQTPPPTTVTGSGTVQLAINTIPTEGYCGDGQIDEGEQCDNGNGNANCPITVFPGCSTSSCTIINSCPLVPPTINGACGVPPDHDDNACSAGTPSAIVSSPSRWTWTCLGSGPNHTDSPQCVEKKSPIFIED